MSLIDQIPPHRAISLSHFHIAHMNICLKKQTKPFTVTLVGFRDLIVTNVWIESTMFNIISYFLIGYYWCIGYNTIAFPLTEQGVPRLNSHLKTVNTFVPPSRHTAFHKAIAPSRRLAIVLFKCM